MPPIQRFRTRFLRDGYQGTGNAHGQSCCTAIWRFSISFDSSAFATYTLKALSFEKPDRDWALFVINNRNRKFSDIGSAQCNHDNKYDIVAGPVANDDIAYLFRTFTSGLIDIDALVRGLEYKQLTT